ncbi:hypothetical protein Deipr_0477 [Deinococcus proteolyticus MRP]|uniref:Uncharacterized protein n=1 Tax=Deinococcus proteolyticus (strain ATCC 35074 / DSM 20540 / JCM 6276 / NBRC 101906 / NCIMB 13154 / VKM Ac-1939 / CCM 2703 / MRP) TaxID=693977 RepID=F0RK86_DEIPM|nr:MULTISPECIES: hypothetical protein [Deinococcus]ADY25645.1 hypothetical protein Deipr_0477 [Deinococcus proteolyticus MRP]MCY1701763.1 hypothetical protein [Deinococcus sp. SL84]
MTYSDQPISADDRARLDQIFMQVVLDVQAQAQQTQPPQAGNLAAMFHKEQVSEVLQGCAMLIAGWNQGRIEGAGLGRTVKGLKALELPELAGRVEKLRNIAEQEV